VKVGLCLLPYFSGQSSNGLVPHLGLALLTAHLRRGDVDVTAIDLRPQARHLASDHVSLLTEEKRFVSEVPALELLVPLLERFLAGCGLDALLDVDRESSDLQRYAEDRRLNPAAMLRSLDEIHRLVASNLGNLGAFDVIGFTAYMSNVYAVFLACAALRVVAPAQTIIVGGPEVTQSEYTARLLLHAGLADAIIPGEALAATAAVIEAKRVGRSLGQLPGVMVLRDHLARAAPARPLPIDELPFPDFSDFDPDAYRRFWFPLATSLGCPFGCSFCSEKDLFGRYRRMSVDRALDHIRRLKERHRCRHVCFGDSLLNVGDSWLSDLADGMVEHDIGFSWEGYLRAGSGRSSLRRLKRAGLSRAVIGIESVSDELLAMMNKAQAARTNVGTIEAFLAEGLAATLTFIVGFPGERAADSHELIRLLERLSDHNREVERTVQAAYRTMGFRALPSPVVPDVGAFPLPFFLKPMSEIYASPSDFSLHVVPYGDRFSDRSIPDRLKELIAGIPRTFDSEREPTQQVYERMLATTEVPGIDGRIGEFVQQVHTCFHGVSDGDRFAIRRPAVFKTHEENGSEVLRYRSLKLGMEILCHGVAGTAVGRLRDGATIGELAQSCTSGSRSAKVELKHLLAAAVVEESVGITLGRGA